jgi:hypothetical protein
LFSWNKKEAEMLDYRGETQTPVTEIFSQVSLRPITDDDMEFLFRLYASTRAGEKALVGWTDEEWDKFMRMQFRHQHSHYMHSYVNPSFDIIGDRQSRRKSARQKPGALL